MIGLFLDYKNPYVTPNLKELKNLLKRNQFSKYLPYLAYDPKTGLYFNKDNSIGFIFKCSPRAFADEELKKNIAGLIELCDTKSILSITLAALPNITTYLKNYKKIKEIKTNENILLKKAVEKYTNFFQEGTKGLPHTLGVPIRNFEIYVAFKAKDKDLNTMNELKGTAKEILEGSYMNPEIVPAEELLKFLGIILNGKEEKINWDAKKPLSKQIIKSNVSITVKNDHIKVGNRFFYCLTPKNVSSEMSLEKMGDIIGGNRGSVDDSNQIPAHFIFTTVYGYDDKSVNLIRSKASLFKRQAEGEDSILARTIGRYAQEHIDAVDKIEKGQKYYYSMPIFWVWNENKQKAVTAAERLKRLMTRQGFTAQLETSIPSPMLIAALPFGMYNEKGEFQQMDRFFLATETESATLAPVIADYKGGGTPHMLFVSRKAQLIPFDPFDKTAPNKNLCVMGTTGGGKSFMLNLYALSMYASGAIIRIFDLGYSYLKLCKMLGGYYLDPDERRICLNSFSFVPESQDKKEIDYYLDSIAGLTGIMAFSDTKEQVTQTQKNLLKGGVRYAWNEFGPEAGITNVFHYLAKFPQLAGQEVEELCDSPESECRKDLAQTAHHLAFNLAAWTTDGIFGEWFNGPANVDLLNSPFIVFELEKLRRVPALLKVVSLAVMNATTAVMYLMPRELKKVVIYEECGVTLQKDELYQAVVEEQYRRGRKNNVSTATVFQSPLDLQKLGPVGEVILGNAAYHFYLPSEDYPKAIKEKILPLEGFENYLASLDSVRPRYTEVGIKSPYGFGAARVIVDSYTYWLATSDPEDWTKLQYHAKQYEERRKETRCQVAGKIWIQQLQKALTIINLSSEGAFISTTEPLPKNAEVFFEFQGQEGHFKGKGKVIHSSKYGIGIKFLKITEGHELLKKLIEQGVKDLEAKISPDSLVNAIEYLEKKRDEELFGFVNGVGD